MELDRDREQWDFLAHLFVFEYEVQSSVMRDTIDIVTDQDLDDPVSTHQNWSSIAQDQTVWVMDRQWIPHVLFDHTAIVPTEVAEREVLAIEAIQLGRNVDKTFSFTHLFPLTT